MNLFFLQNYSASVCSFVLAWEKNISLRIVAKYDNNKNKTIRLQRIVVQIQ